MTPCVYLRPGSGAWLVQLPHVSREPARAGATPGFTFRPARGKEPAGVAIDTNRPGLLELAWRNAAEAVLRDPPECPLTDSPRERELSDRDADLLPRLWPDWLRVATNFAIHYPEEMERWGGDFAADDQLALASAATAVFERWRDDYPVDLWVALHRASGHGSAPPRLPDAERANPTFRFGALLPDSPGGLRALARAFLWRRDVAADARPGLLERRWVHGPGGAEPLLSVHLAHPGADPLAGRFRPRESPDGCAIAPLEPVNAP